ncbi:MAG: heterodisulfide reductase subunit C, partial [Bacteroidetes bacterium]|nr:heterodisulfide reductase subunit C [Bacteroidota bacterium]
MQTENIKEVNIRDEILQKTGVDIRQCYQCGKCTAGCPVANEMDYPSSVIMRMLQTEEKCNEDKVKNAYSIWLCLSCEMCYE